MLDTHNPIQFKIGVCCSDENYWQLKYKLNLHPWFYLIYTDKEEKASDQELLLIPDTRQLEKFIIRSGIEAEKIYLLTPCYVNGSQDWKLHKILKINKAASNLYESFIFKCILEKNYYYMVGLCEEENREALEFETIFEDSDNC